MLQLKYLFDAYVNKFTESDGTQTHIHTHKAQTNKWKMMEMLIKSYFQGLSERVESNGVKSQDEAKPKIVRSTRENFNSIQILHMVLKCRRIVIFEVFIFICSEVPGAGERK